MYGFQTGVGTGIIVTSERLFSLESRNSGFELTGFEEIQMDCAFSILKDSTSH